MRLFPALCFSMLFLLSLDGFAAWQGKAKAPAIFVDSEGVAIAGYDVVSYFEGSVPRKGTTMWQADHKGARFLFASDANRQRFVKDPDRFVPQFGGYCAFAMAAGKRKSCDPRRFSLRDGKLFLFSGATPRDRWLQDEASWLAKAVAAWRSLMGQE
ncbi:MAG: YHS domain-containing (seleno)protein [Bryobacterales bacterium]|nr:YHS domain-containing (seleno)protein [Bryobacterales bacterium]